MSQLKTDRRDSMKRGFADIVRMAALCCLLLLSAPDAFAAASAQRHDFQQATHSVVAADTVNAATAAHPCERAMTSGLLDCGCVQLCLTFGVLPTALRIDDAGQARVLSARPYRLARAGHSPAKHPPRLPAPV